MRLKKGDTDAFDEVYQHYRPIIFSFLARMTQHREIAEDLLQETWLRLAANAHNLADNTNIKAWLFTVARNLCYSHQRQRMLFLDHRHWLWLTSTEIMAVTSPFDLTCTRQFEQHLEQALAQLPEKYREVVLLMAIEDLDHRAAADILGIRPDALRKRLSRGREMLSNNFRRIEKGKIHNVA